MQALHQHKLTSTEYLSIGELSGKTELIDGVIYDMVPPGPNHSYTVGELAKILIISLKNEIIRQEQPLQLLPHDAPQPDIAILKFSESRYKTVHPDATDVIALIEVSDSTLNYDTNGKMVMYARENIPFYYVVDISNQLIWEHSNPEVNGYQAIKKCKEIKIESLEISIDIESII